MRVNNKWKRVLVHYYVSFAGNIYTPCVKSLMACNILLTWPTFVTPISFKSLLANVNSSLPLISFLTKPSIYSDNCNVSNQVATSCVPHDATSLAVLWLCCCWLDVVPFVRNFNQNKPLRLCSDWKIILKNTNKYTEM